MIGEGRRLCVGGGGGGGGGGGDDMHMNCIKRPKNAGMAL